MITNIVGIVLQVLGSAYVFRTRKPERPFVIPLPNTLVPQKEKRRIRKIKFIGTKPEKPIVQQRLC